MLGLRRKPLNIPDPEPQIGSFRISPDGLQFKVEEYDYHFSKLCWCQAGLWYYGKYPEGVCPWGDEETCERYIHWRLEKKRKSDEYNARCKAHALANPPRDVPPYKYLKD